MRWKGTRLCSWVSSSSSHHSQFRSTIAIRCFLVPEFKPFGESFNVFSLFGALTCFFCWAWAMPVNERLDWSILGCRMFFMWLKGCVNRLNWRVLFYILILISLFMNEVFKIGPRYIYTNFSVCYLLSYFGNRIM